MKRLVVTCLARATKDPLDFPTCQVCTRAGTSSCPRWTTTGAGVQCHRRLGDSFARGGRGLSPARRRRGPDQPDPVVGL